ncbi:MAG TPA: hypothetical protein VFX70_09220 [Mycobacteriales bacterium]|nr:hypothetical protein [Mycobacteriales bacterium]
MPAHRATLPRTVRSPRTRRVNRLVLGLVGLLLLLGGGAGLAAGFGVLGGAVPHRPVLTGTARYADAHAWVWAAVGVAGLVVATLGAAWLVVQSRSNRIRELDVPDGPEHPHGAEQGRTVLAGDAVTDAVRAEVESYPGVRDASAQLVTERGTPTLLVSAALDGRSGPGQVRTRIQTGAVSHARRALDDPGLPARLELRLASRPRRHLR